MKTNKIIFAAIFTLIVSGATAQSKFPLSDPDLTLNNNITLNAIGAAGNPLKFEKNANGALLKWQSNNESNTSHFELQISYDNKNFETTQKIAASYLSTWNTSYEVKFRRTYISEEKIYYRIKIVFNDGSEKITPATAFEIAAGNAVNYASIH